MREVREGGQGEGSVGALSCIGGGVRLERSEREVIWRFELFWWGCEVREVREGGQGERSVGDVSCVGGGVRSERSDMEVKERGQCGV